MESGYASLAQKGREGGGDLIPREHSTWSVRRIQKLEETAAARFKSEPVRRPVSPERPPRFAQPVTPDPEPPQDYSKSPVTPDEAFPDGPPSPKEAVAEEHQEEAAEEELPIGSTMFAMFPLQE